jgi:hypothetical protein
MKYIARKKGAKNTALSNFFPSRGPRQFFSFIVIFV